MRWSGAEGYAKGDVISNYHIQGPHIHLCTCWYKWHFVVTIGCTFVTASTSFQPSTCSNVFRLSGFGTEGSYHFSSWWYFLLLTSRKSYPISQRKKDPITAKIIWVLEQPTYSRLRKGKKAKRPVVTETLSSLRSEQKPCRSNDAATWANADCGGQLMLLFCFRGHVVVQQVCGPRLSLGVLAFLKFNQQMETLELQNGLELFGSF